MRPGGLTDRATLIALLLLLAGLVLPGAEAPAAPRTPSVGPAFDTLVADARAAMLTDPHIAVEKALAARRYADGQLPSSRRAIMQATADWLRGEALLRLNDVEDAKPFVDRAVRVAARLAPGSPLHGDALLARGWIDTAQADVADALNDYQAAYSIFRRNGEVRSQSKALQSIGALYISANDYVSALKYFDQALASYHTDPMLALSLFNNRAGALKFLGRLHEAEAQYAKALALTAEMKSPLLRALVLGNIAETRLAMRQVAGAQRAIDEALRLSSTGGGEGYRKVAIALDAQAAFQRGDLARAKTLIGERFANEDLAKATLIDRQALQTAYTIYGASGDAAKALRYLTVLKRLDDEATKLARSANAALMAARFDFANQELRIASLQRDEARRNVAFEQARTRTQRDLFLGVVAATALIVGMLAIGVVTLRRSRDRVRAANSDLEKALAAKTEFLATTSHEIRTPLNGILGMTQVMLADHRIAGSTRDRLAVLHGAGVTMRALVDDILDAAKIESGRLMIEDAPFDLAAMLRDSARLWHDQAAAKALVFHAELTDCPGMIQGDALRTRQIVFNLMSNALKFTECGSVTLSAVTAGDRLRIAVADTGMGIAADQIEAIFETFRQADSSTTRRFGGTGLGLSITRSLAQAMGGDVSVVSVPGKGACFTVDLPLVRVALPDVVATRPAPGLLIVDANPIARAMLNTLLAPHAGSVTATASLDEALALPALAEVARIVVDATLLVAADTPCETLGILSAAAGAASITVLWPAGSATERAAVPPMRRVMHVMKPVGGADLVEAVFARDHASLVTQAA